jgi:hypothetical protein
VILGWSPQVFAILGELALANESRRRAASSSRRPRQ